MLIVKGEGKEAGEEKILSRAIGQVKLRDEKQVVRPGVY